MLCPCKQWYSKTQQCNANVIKYAAVWIMWDCFSSKGQLHGCGNIMTDGEGHIKDKLDDTYAENTGLPTVPVFA